MTTGRPTLADVIDLLEHAYPPRLAESWDRVGLVAGDPAVSMAGAGVVYLGQLILLVGALLALHGASWLEGDITAFSAVVATVVLQAGQVTGYVRSRHVIYPQAGRA